MIRWLVNALLSPLVSLGGKYLDNQKDKAKLEAGITQAAYAADYTFRRIKLSYVLLRIPLFIAEMACAIYIVAVLWDSTFPMESLTPLELPEWFKPHFYMMCASIFGLATFERVVGRRK